ncbi:MAG: PEP-CTERM sorting domain-containing protein [Rhodospirillales bacterium]|jgi:hypothetical protein|nr:PEP-CTERM sorting domain-containing protein [Rhodospirillales bacterium]
MFNINIYQGRHFVKRLAIALCFVLTVFLMDSAFNDTKAILFSNFSANLGVTGPGQNDVFYVPTSNPFASVTITGISQVSFSVRSGGGSSSESTIVKNVNYLFFQGQEVHDDYLAIFTADAFGTYIGSERSYSLTKLLPVGKYEATVFLKLTLESSEIIFSESSAIRNFSVVASDTVPEPGSGVILIAGLVLGGIALRKRSFLRLA